MPASLLRELNSLLGPSNVLHKIEDLVLYEYDGSVEKAARIWSYSLTPRKTSRVSSNSQRNTMCPLSAALGNGPLWRRTRARRRHHDRVRADEPYPRARSRKCPRRCSARRGEPRYHSRVEHAGLYFAPDPSSQKSCTIGGNVARMPVSAHSAYGVTVNHVTALELVLPDGEIVRVAATRRHPGLRSLRALCGSEGTLALVTEITVKLTRKAEAVKTLLAIFDALMTLPTPSLKSPRAASLPPPAKW